MTIGAEQGPVQIELRVESLEFEGLHVAEPARVQQAFIAELDRLLTVEGLPEGLRTAGAEIDGGALTPWDLQTPERLGQALARRVYGGLGG